MVGMALLSFKIHSAVVRAALSVRSKETKVHLKLTVLNSQRDCQDIPVTGIVLSH